MGTAEVVVHGSVWGTAEVVVQLVGVGYSRGSGSVGRCGVQQMAVIPWVGVRYYEPVRVAHTETPLSGIQQMQKLAPKSPG